MPVRIQVDPAHADAIGAALADLTVDGNLLVLAWSHPEAAALLDEHVRAGGALLALCGDAEAAAQALESGASEAVVWPIPVRLLQLRAHAACRNARDPFLRQLFELVSASVELTTTDAVLLDVNPAFERVTGYAHDDVIGRTPAQLFRSAVHDPDYYRQIGRALDDAGVWNGQLAARRGDQSLSIQQATIALVHDAKSRVVGHLAIKRDTSRDNLARAALQTAAGPIQTLMDRAAEAVIVHGLDGSIADVNRAACSVLGLPREALLARRATDLYVDDPAWLVTGWSKLELDRPTTRENRLRRADGTTIPVELSVGKAKVVGTEFVLVIARDISERRTAELEAADANARLRQLNEHLELEVDQRTRTLRETLAQHQAIVHNLAEGLVAADPNGLIEALNPRMLELLEATGHYIGLPVDRLSPVLGELARRCIAQREVTTVEMALPGGRFGAVLASPIRDEHAAGRPILGCVMLVRDVTLAREVDRMKTDFIATVSHELRTPLTSVLGFAKLALGRLSRIEPFVPADDKKATRAMTQVRSNLEIIAAEGNRLAALINDVLDISKIESGRVDWKADAVRADALVDHVIEVTRGLFTTKEGPQLIREVEPDLPELVGDRNRLIQVLINLVSNAVKFTDQGTITISASRTTEGVDFRVVDTGLGIPQADHDAIFERFKQSGDTRTDRPKGTGLGLPISKAIVEHHGGQIGVESTVGGGSTFWFTLPAASAVQSHPPAADLGLAPLLAQIERVRHSQGPADILVVDDDPALRELMSQLLDEAGHRVRLAENGAQAIDMVRQRAPDLLVLDVVMPGLSGFDVAAVIRADPKTEHLPILVVSILADDRRGVHVGVDRLLGKPVDEAELLRAIDALLHADSARRRVLLACDDPVQRDAIRAHVESIGDVVIGTCTGDECRAVAHDARPELIIVVGASGEQLEELRADPVLAQARVLALIDR